VFLAVALVGTTVAPWQLFFQQSNVVDKRITTRFLGYERADTALGTVLFAVGALGVLLACAFAFGRPGPHGAFTDAAATARGLRVQAGGAAGTLFAVVLGAGSVLGASAVTLATSYAVGDSSACGTRCTAGGARPGPFTAPTRLARWQPPRSC
jgi:Mn2+/Fe2+ NRAMP family transporter